MAGAREARGCSIERFRPAAPKEALPPARRERAKREGSPLSALPQEAAAPSVGPIVTPAFLRDPYPTYRTLREAGPVVWSDEFFGGAWLVSRHADVETVLRDPRFSARRTGAWVGRANRLEAGAEGADDETGIGRPGAFQALFARALLFLDAPDHPRVRRVLSAVFRPDALRRLAPAIEAAADDLLSPLDFRAGVDFMTTVARPLPARVIASLIGLPPDADEPFAEWCDALAGFIGDPDPGRDALRRAETALIAMARSFDALLASRRLAAEGGADDAVAYLLQAEAAGRLQAGAETLAQCAMLLFAGYETTRNLLGNGLYALLSHPAQWQRLRDRPALLPNAVREMLRWDSPVQYTGRRVATDLVLHGRSMKRGDLVLALIGSANRDPARHERPDEFDIARPDPGTLAFGTGPHVCIGAALTQMEALAVFGPLVRDAPWPSLQATAIVRDDNPVYRGIHRLNVRA